MTSTKIAHLGNAGCAIIILGLWFHSGLAIIGGSVTIALAMWFERKLERER